MSIKWKVGGKGPGAGMNVSNFFGKMAFVMPGIVKKMLQITCIVLLMNVVLSQFRYR